MSHQDDSRDFPVLAEAGSQSQQHDKSEPDRSQSRCRQMTSAWKEIAETRAMEGDQQERGGCTGREEDEFNLT